MPLLLSLLFPLLLPLPLLLHQPLPAHLPVHVQELVPTGLEAAGEGVGPTLLRQEGVLAPRVPAAPVTGDVQT